MAYDSLKQIRVDRAVNVPEPVDHGTKLCIPALEVLGLPLVICKEHLPSPCESLPAHARHQAMIGLLLQR